jgi:hypothetical protein
MPGLVPQYEQRVTWAVKGSLASPSAWLARTARTRDSTVFGLGQ